MPRTVHCRRDRPPTRVRPGRRAPEMSMAKVPASAKPTLTTARAAVPAARPAAPTKLNDAQIEDALKAVPEWSLVGEAIQRTCLFNDFVIAMRFVDEIALAAEAAQHHPDILIRYNRVTLTLATHDAGGITAKDFDLARKADALAAKHAPAPKLKREGSPA